MPITYGVGTQSSYGDIAAWDGATKMTWSWWQYLTSTVWSASEGVISKGNTLAASLVFETGTGGGGGTASSVGLYDGSASSYVGSVLAANIWQHYAVTYDGSQSAGSRCHVYLNGVSQTMTADNVGAALPSNTSVVSLGDCLGGPGVFDGWNGTLAFVKVWAGVTLTASEVWQEWNTAEPQTNLSSIMLYVPGVFNDTAALASRDFTGLGYTVSVTGSPTSATVSEPPVFWPAGAQMGHRNNYRRMDALRRNRFQRLSPLRPLVQYG